MYRVLRRDSVMRAARVVRIVLLGVMALTVAAMVWGFLNRGLELQTGVLSVQSAVAGLAEAPPPAAKRQRQSADFALIEQRNLFGPFTTRQAAAAPTPKPVAQVPLDLIGTFVTKGEPPYAIIEDRNKRLQEVFLVGDSIFDTANLVAVYPDRVEIERDGKVEVLNLDLTPASGSAGASGPATEEFVVDEAEIEQALNNLPLLLTQARAVPYFKDGQAVGLRLFAIKAGSLFEKVGLRNGDILKSINGSALGDLTQAVKLFERLRDERSINVVLERNRTEQTFRYQIR